jgi:hypothetical protein
LCKLSIPNGLPRPFSQNLDLPANKEDEELSIPNGLPRPFSQNLDLPANKEDEELSIPNGLPRPFSQNLDLPANKEDEELSIPNGLPRPFSHKFFSSEITRDLGFQSQTGSPGHLARESFIIKGKTGRLSIPNGLPRPFSLGKNETLVRDAVPFNPKRAPQAI